MNSCSRASAQESTVTISEYRGYGVRNTAIYGHDFEIYQYDGKIWSLEKRKQNLKYEIQSTNDIESTIKTDSRQFLIYTD